MRWEELWLDDPAWSVPPSPVTIMATRRVESSFNSAPPAWFPHHRNWLNCFHRTCYLQWDWDIFSKHGPTLTYVPILMWKYDWKLCSLQWPLITHIKSASQQSMDPVIDLLQWMFIELHCNCSVKLEFPKFFPSWSAGTTCSRRSAVTFPPFCSRGKNRSAAVSQRAWQFVHMYHHMYHMYHHVF